MLPCSRDVLEAELRTSVEALNKQLSIIENAQIPGEDLPCKPANFYKYIKTLKGDLQITAQKLLSLADLLEGDPSDTGEE